jgi:hypothetical protein
MKRPYLLLFALVVVLAAALTALGRSRPHHAPRAEPATEAPVVELTLGILDGRMTPAVASVAKGSRVRLRVDYRGERPARLALAGYHDRLAIPALAPGAVWVGEFLADRPGEDFAWLLDGEPAGRLAVTGSHLVEGHR